MSLKKPKSNLNFGPLIEYTKDRILFIACMTLFKSYYLRKNNSYESALSFTIWKNPEVNESEVRYLTEGACSQELKETIQNYLGYYGDDACHQDPAVFTEINEHIRQFLSKDKK